MKKLEHVELWYKNFQILSNYLRSRKFTTGSVLFIYISFFNKIIRVKFADWMYELFSMQPQNLLFLPFKLKPQLPLSFG